jgi:hypothetical protein
LEYFALYSPRFGMLYLEKTCNPGKSPLFQSGVNFMKLFWPLIIALLFSQYVQPRIGSVIITN